MKESTRVRFNPSTKEIEVQGSEAFVKTYFSKLQAMMSGAQGKEVKEKPKTTSVKKPKRGKTTKAKQEKKVTNVDKVVSLVQASAEGISTAGLKEKTGLTERQIWSIVNVAQKEGKIKKMKRGLYGAA